MNEAVMSKKRTRIVGLDLYRLLSVFLIFLFHSNIHIQCNYGVLNQFVNNGAIYMTAFFILSGFSLYLVWQRKDLHNIVELRKFYLKRLISILPLYYSVALIYICFLGQESTVQNLLIAPVEILGIQSIFNSLFGVTHNGGTWFVSCILMCYLVYPLIQEIIKQLTSKLKVTIILIAVFILLYSPLIVHFFKTSGIYSNPFFRIMEFLIGTIICSLIPSIQGSKLSKIIFSWWVILIEHAVLIICITEAVKHNIAVGNYMLYSWVALPMFMVIIISMYGAKSPRNMVNSKIVNYLCEISYAFFLCQFFSWKTTMFIISKIGMDNNLLRIGISFMVCMGYTVLLHEALEKPISNYLKKKLL